MMSSGFGFESWEQVGKLARVAAPAGPLISASAADAAVVRLRRASQWALPLLPEATGLAAADRVSKTSVLVVNRHSLSRAIVRVLEPLPVPSPSVGLIAAVAIRKLTVSAQAFWQPFEEGLLLVAPNVWQTAARHRLDQTDYAKWVALRSGLWGVYFTEAPWLADYFRRQVSQAPRRSMEVARVSVLLAQLVAAQLEFITPKQILSVEWIRGHLPRSGLIIAVGQLRLLGDVMPDLTALEAAAHNFVHVTNLHRDPDALTLLLRSPDYLPTEEELATPRMWKDRVGLG